MKKRYLISILVVVLVVVAVLLPACAKEEAPATPTGEPIVLKAMMFSSDNDVSVAEPYYRLIDKINERAKGELIIKHVGGLEAIPAFDQFDALKTGVFDIGVNNESYYGGQVTGLPVTYLSEYAPWEERESGYYDLRVELLEGCNVRYLGRPGGYGLGYRIYTNKLVKNPREGFKGQRLRISPTYEPWCRALGASPVTLPFPDIYTGMERGTIDGFIIACSLALDFSWDEVTKYYSPRVFTFNLEVLANLDSWNRLPKHLQDLVEDCVAEFERETADESAAYVNDYEQRMQDAGMVPLEQFWSQADIEWFSETAYKASWEEVKAKVSPELYSKLVEASSKHQ